MTLDSTGALSLGRLNGTGGSRGFALGMRRVNGSNPFAGSNPSLARARESTLILRGTCTHNLKTNLPSRLGEAAVDGDKGSSFRSVPTPNKRSGELEHVPRA